MTPALEGIASRVWLPRSYFVAAVAAVVGVALLAARASILMGTEPVWALLVGVAIGGEAIERRHRLARRASPEPAAATAGLRSVEKAPPHVRVGEIQQLVAAPRQHGAQGPE